MMVACPAPMAVTSPVLLTLATAVSSLFQVPVNVRPSDAVAVICSFAPTSTMSFGEVTAMVTVGGAGDVVLLLPQAAAEITSRRTQPGLNIGGALKSIHPLEHCVESVSRCPIGYTLPGSFCAILSSDRWSNPTTTKNG